jgi:peptide/nickel transport system ATP-binding protein/oligopeptide transport system ATP-binding protein
LAEQLQASDGLLAVDDLRVSFATEGGLVEAVRGVSFRLARGEVLGLVGESGCGKSVTAMALTGLNRSDPNARFSGSVRYDGRELLSLGERELRGVRGAQIAMIFQDPMTSLNPVYRVGDLIAEALRAHVSISRRGARARAVELLREVGIPEAERRARDYPHRFSGGMRQRVMIALALACEPAVLVADEPTTALDVTIQAQILRLIQRTRETRQAAVVLITHDLGVVARMADRVAVMYAGRIVEEGAVRDVFHRPQHPYTWGLLDSIPRLDRPRSAHLRSIAGQPPSLIRLPAGCAFAPRCAHVHDRCSETPPLEDRAGGGHLDACWLSPEAKLVRGAHAAAP